MTSFINADSHNALLVLLFGTATFAGCMGLGQSILRLVGANLPAPFLQIVAVLTGIQANSVAVQAVAMGQIATPEVLAALWCTLFASGVLGPLLSRRDVPVGVLPTVPRTALAIAVAACGANLVAAVVPSSKIDELYYHMLLPARIVADHGLLIYRAPLESAILPHMVYQIFAAPLHAIGYPDAPNIVSWLLSVMLVWSGWTLLRQQGVRSAAPFCLVAAIASGAYPVVFHVTGGSHAFGDLSLATALLVVLTGDALLGVCGPVAFALTVSLLSWSAASSKVSLFPVAFAVLLLGAWMALRSVRAADSRIPVIAALSGAWLVFGAPLMVWTWLKTGSPFGPVLAGQFGATPYDRNAFRDFADGSRGSGGSALDELIFDNLVGYPALLWLAAIVFLFSSAVPLQVRLRGGAILLVQFLVVACLLPWHARFLGGLQYAVAICVALYCARQIASFGRVVVIALALGLAPWIAGQLYFAQQFAGMAIGIEDRDLYYRRYVAFYDDFVKLDRVLPGNAVFLVTDFRPPAAYSSRPMIFDVADARPGSEIFMFSGSEPRSADIPANFLPAGRVYYNALARREVYRRPWARPLTGDLYVTRLARRDALRP